MTKINMDDIVYLRKFISAGQMEVMVENTQGEEGDFFRAKITKMAALIRAMPCVTDEERPSEGTAFLHYFGQGGDWYIAERDMDGPQFQAFGYARLTDFEIGAEYGYISIVELIQNGMSLDLFWTPRPMAQIVADREIPF